MYIVVTILGLRLDSITSFHVNILSKHMHNVLKPVQN